MCSYQGPFHDYNCDECADSGLTDDRERFMGADAYPVAMADGVVVSLVNDEDPMDPEPGMFYTGLMVETAGFHDSIWSIETPEHWSGHQCREHIFEAFVVDFLKDVRKQRDSETVERCYWAARGVVTER